MKKLFFSLFVLFMVISIKSFATSISTTSSVEKSKIPVVSFYNNDGTLLEEVEAIEYKNKYYVYIDINPAPKNDEIFVGWSKEENDESSLIENGKVLMLKNDLILYPIYQALENDD